MTTLRTAAQQALKALEADCGGRCNAEYNPCWQREAAETLRAALAEDAMQKFTDVNQELEAALAEPVEPVAWMNTEDGFCTLDSPVEGIDVMSQWVPLYGSPPQRKPLTDDEIHDCWQQRHRDKTTERRLITRAIERAHGIGEQQ